MVYKYRLIIKIVNYWWKCMSRLETQQDDGYAD